MGCKGSKADVPSRLETRAFDQEDGHASKGSHQASEGYPREGGQHVLEVTDQVSSQPSPAGEVIDIPHLEPLSPAKEVQVIASSPKSVDDCHFDGQASTGSHQASEGYLREGLFPRFSLFNFYGCFSAYCKLQGDRHELEVTYQVSPKPSPADRVLDSPDSELLSAAREVQAHLDRSEEVLAKETAAHEKAEAKLSEARLIATEEEVKLLLDAVQESEQGLPEKEVQADRYDLSDPLALARFLQDADIRLVRAKYLAELVLAQQPLPRRQEAESLEFTSGGITQTALVTHEEVQEWATGSRKAIMCSISHAWETREHPDPCRYQLEHIVSHTALFEAAFKADVWVFYDYTSLFQYERDPNSHEERSFRKAMANMHLMYCHECNLTFRIESLTPSDTWNAMMANEKECVPVWDQKSKTVKALPLKSLVENRNLYLERGWCMAEVEWSSLRRVNAQHQRIDKLKAGENSDKSEEGQNLNGKIPMTPERFKAAMEKSKFTHRSDEEAVIHLQEKIYSEKVTACAELILEGLPRTEVAALAASLPDFKNLKAMKVSNFRCGEEEAKTLGEVLAISSVESVELHARDSPDPDNLFRVTAHDRASGLYMAKALAEALQVNTTITNIDLTGNQIGKEGAKALAEALQVNRTVTNIDLKFNNIGKEGAEALAEALRVNNTVTKIDLGYNGIGKEGTKALAEALKVNKTVTRIDLSFNEIWAEGAEVVEVVERLLAERKQPQAEPSSGVESGRDQETDRHPFQMPVRLQALAEELKVNKTLTNIHLGWNGGLWLQALAEALKVNKTVTNIDLSRSNMGKEGAKALAEALRVNNTVTNIDLSCKEIGKEGAEALKKVVEEKRKKGFDFTVRDVRGL